MVKITLILVLICVGLNFVSNKLGEHLENISNDIKMDKDISGATFLAISSSLPEFLTAFQSIVIFKKFEEVGFATVAGSGIFNALLIPMLSILFYKGKDLNFKVSMRDTVFYSITIAVLAISMYLGAFSWMTGVVLVLVYLVYLKTLASHQSEPIKWKNAKKKDILISLVLLVPMAFLVHSAVENVLELSDIIGIKAFFVSVIVLSGVTSIPDTFMSINEAKKGEIESAVSNAIGSNIFDLCICIGLPLILTGAKVPVSLADNLGILVFLVLSVAVTGGVLKTGIKKWKTIPMTAVYSIFIAYILMSS